jgi:hypothetical protein
MLNSLLNGGLIDYVDGSDFPSMAMLKEEHGQGFEEHIRHKLMKVVD